MCVCVYIYIQTERETAILKLHGNCKPKVYNRYTHNKGGGIQTQHRRVIKSLEYSCFTMLCQFLLYSKVNQPYIYLLFFFFFNFFPIWSPQSIEQSSLCYTVGSHQVSVLCIVSIVYVPQSQSPNLSPHLGIHTFVLQSVSLFPRCK